jgi:hypothetical protein
MYFKCRQMMIVECDFDVVDAGLARMLSRLLMPSRRALPPVECCLGTIPSHAENSRPLRKAAPLPIAATIAVATTGPMPGIFWMR